MSQVQHPKGPCPDPDVLFPIVAKFIKSDGAQNLTFRTLRIKTEAELKVDLSPYTTEIQSAAEKAVKQPKQLQEIQQYAKDRELGLVSKGLRKKGKRGSKRSSGEKGEKREKRIKKEKEDQGPKKPLTAFFMFSNEQRAKVRAENPDFTIGEIGKRLGVLWGDISDEERARVDKLVEKDKERYARECDEWVASGKKLVSRSGKVKKEKDDSGPKKPLTAFFMFSNEQRGKIKEQNPDFTIGEIGKRLGVLWGELTSDDKKKYDDLSAKDRLRYERECTETGYVPAARKASSGKKKSSGSKRTKRPRSTSDSSSASSFSSTSDSDSSSSSSGSSNSSSSLSSSSLSSSSLSSSDNE